MKNYLIVNNALDKSICQFLTGYFLLKRRAFKTMLDKGYVMSNLDEDHGTYNDKQVGNCFSVYSDIAAETILQIAQKKVEAALGFDLVPTYSYTRVYDKGHQLYRHRDRPSCQFSSTLNIGGDLWPIYLDPTGSDNIISKHIDEKGDEVTIIKPDAPKGDEVILQQGDMLIYQGEAMEHWRNPLEGEYCVQTFLHYNKKDKEKNNIYDSRLHLGLPAGTRYYLK